MDGGCDDWCMNQTKKLDVEPFAPPVLTKQKSEKSELHEKLKDVCHSLAA
jgi:hypothetical protein